MSNDNLTTSFTRKWLEKYKHSVLKKKTPILGFTVIQLFILLVVINGGAAAVLLSQRQPPVIKDPSASSPTYEGSVEKNTPTTSTSTPDTTQGTTSNSQNPTTNTVTTSNDAWAEKHDKEMEELNKQLAEQDRCRSLEKAANDKYSIAIKQAQAAYDVVMAEWNQVKDLPYYQRNPYEEYATDAKTKFNAISKPAYSEYVATLSYIRTQGCQVTQLHSDYSWVGF